MKKNLIVLKNFKHHDNMSEETLCFSADVWIGGYKAGYAKNGGYGGQTDIHGYDAKGRELLKFASNQIQAMPPEIIEYMGRTLTINSTLENFIDKLTEDMIQEKENKRISNWVKKKLPTGIVAKNGDEYHYFPFFSRNTPEGRQMIINVAKKNYPNCEILNKF
jgi:hypothetical protein